MSSTIKTHLSPNKKIPLLGSVELTFTEDTVTFEDKTKAKSTWSAIDFPDGSKGAIIITKLIKGQWKPLDDVKRIIVEFQ